MVLNYYIYLLVGQLFLRPMHEESLKQISKHGIIEIISEEKPVHEHRHSIFMKEYQRLLNTSESLKIDLEQIMEKLKCSNIHYDSRKFHIQMTIEIQDYSANFEAVKLNVQYGHFEVTVNIINVDSISPFQSLEIVGSGGFGGIYKYVDGDEVTAIKSIKIEEDKFDFVFQQVVKEYILFKIAAVLNVAPKANTIFGFDIVVFSDCLNFSMEYCEIGAVHFQETIDLDKKLALLHHLHIVHLDIKPQNIGLSCRNGYIFIDFGLSKMVRQKVGEQTLSSFAGSINFCSKQMLGLFSKNCAGYVDLYYNDAFCLGEALKVLDAQPKQDAEMQSMNEYLSSIRSNLSWLYAYRLLLETKFFLFQLSSGRLSETNFFSRNSDFVKQRKTQIIKFVMFLPQSLELIQFLKRYLKCQRENKKVYLSNETIVLQKTDQQSLSEAFKSRFKIIQNLKLQGQKPGSTNKCLQVNQLFNVKNIKMFSAGLYKLALVQFIKINSFNKDFNEKLFACSLCFQTYITSEEAVTGTKLYKRVMQFIFETSLNVLEPENPQIIINAIETVVVLELFDDKYLVDAFKLILDFQITFTQKIKIYLQFATSIQLIFYKFSTKYSYRSLSTFLESSIKSYLNSINGIIDINERSICLIISEIILLKELSSRNSHQKFKLHNFFKDDSNKMPFYFKNINQKLENMKIYQEIMAQISTQNTCTLNIKPLLNFLNRQNYHCQTFTCLHLLLYRINKKALHLEINKNIYHLFYQQMKYFDEHKYFDIYIFNSIAIIKQSSPNKLTLQRKQMLDYSEFKYKQASLDYVQIFQLLDIAVRSCKKSYAFIGQLMFGYPGLYSNKNCLNHLNSLLNKSNFLTKCSIDVSKEAQPHSKTLPFDMILAAHIFEFLSNTNQQLQKWDQRICNYMIQCEEHISRIACFKCKVYGLLQMNSLYRMYLSAQNRWQQSFLSALNLMVFYMKSKQLQKSAYDIIVPLIRTWQDKSQLLTKYNPIGLIYSFTKAFNLQIYTLIDVSEYNIFANVYLYIVYNLSHLQMIQFVLNITKSLGKSKSANQINKFYYSIMHLIQIFQQQHNQDFCYYHISIIQQLFQFQNLKQHPFVALYFSSLLEMQSQCYYSMKMLRVISISIQFLGKCSENLIFNNYYDRFAQYCKQSVRKRRFALSLHLKKSSMKVSLPHILKIKMKEKTKKKISKQNEMFKSKLLNFMKILKNHIEKA